MNSRNNEFTATLTINPGDTFVLSGDQSGPFTVTMLNEGQADVVVVCDLSDYESAVTLGPQGQSTRRLAAKGSATLTNQSETNAAEMTINFTSVKHQAVGIERRPS